MKYLKLIFLSTVVMISCNNSQKQKSENKLMDDNKISEISNDSVIVKEPLQEPLLYDVNDRDLKIDFDFEEDGDRIYFYGTTNLPDGTKLGISLTDNKGFNAQDYKIFVKKNRFRSSAFSSRGSKLTGKYNAELLTHFNKAWQKDPNILEKLDEYKGSQIKTEKSEIFGKQKSIGVEKQFVFGSKDHLAEKKSKCQEFNQNAENVIKEIERKIAELENLYKSNPENSFGIEIGKWNRENRDWREKSERILDNDCCRVVKFPLSIAITNLDLLGIAYSGIYRNGDNDVKLYKTEAMRNAQEAQKQLANCK